VVPLALAVLYIVWGSTYYAMRVALLDFPPFSMGGIRFVLAGTVLLVLMRARGAELPTARGWASAAVTGTLLLVLGNGLVGVAEHAGIGSGVAATVIATMPLWAVLFGAALGERPSWGELVGLVVGFSGVVVLRSGGALAASVTGMIAIACAPAAWALGSVWSRRLPLPKGQMAAAAQMIAAGVIMGTVGIVRGEHVAVAPRPSALWALAYLIVFGSIVAFSAYGYLLRTVRPALATSYAYVNPVVALAIGAWLGHEPFGATHAIACAWTLVGVAIVAVARSRPKALPQPVD
jgi:drug/metabolite transporter (DMT)-like permease